MRTIVLCIAWVLVSAACFAGKTITGKSNTLLNEYSITPVGENLYQLSYSNADETFSIEVCPSANECCYLVRGKSVELMYLCNNLGFGMRKMPEKLKKVETAVYENLIAPETFRQQSQITCKNKDRESALAMIACFFPLTIKAESVAMVFNYAPQKSTDELTVK